MLLEGGLIEVIDEDEPSSLFSCVSSMSSSSSPSFLSPASNGFTCKCERLKFAEVDTANFQFQFIFEGRGGENCSGNISVNRFLKGFCHIVFQYVVHLEKLCRKVSMKRYLNFVFTFYVFSSIAIMFICTQFSTFVFYCVLHN